MPTALKGSPIKAGQTLQVHEAFIRKAPKPLPTEGTGYVSSIIPYGNINYPHLKAEYKLGSTKPDVEQEEMMDLLGKKMKDVQLTGFFFPSLRGV